MKAVRETAKIATSSVMSQREEHNAPDGSRCSFHTPGCPGSCPRGTAILCGGVASVHHGSPLQARCLNHQAIESLEGFVKEVKGEAGLWKMGGR